MPYKHQAAQNRYMREVWYPKHKDRYRAASARWAAAHRSKIAGLKDAPCTDCGVQYLPCVMEWDHVAGDKVANVGDMGTRYSLADIMAEAAKCELVCANCHRLRTHNRRVAKLAKREPHKLVIAGSSPAPATKL